MEKHINKKKKGNLKHMKNNKFRTYEFDNEIEFISKHV